MQDLPLDALPMIKNLNKYSKQNASDARIHDRRSSLRLP